MKPGDLLTEKGPRDTRGWLFIDSSCTDFDTDIDYGPLLYLSHEDVHKGKKLLRVLTPRGVRWIYSHLVEVICEAG